MQTLRFIGFLIFVGIGCKSNEQFIIPKQISVQPQAKIISLDQVFRKVEVLTLQGETGLFSIYRMMPYQGGFLFTDTKKERVYISDARGKVSLFMDQKGEGPGEYRSIWDLKIHPNGENFAILDRGLAKVLIYDSKGNSVKELSMKRRLMSSINSFDFLDSESLVFFTSGSPGVKFLVLNLSTETLELKVPIENELDGLAFGNDRSMTFVNDRISVIYPLSRKIERYTTDFSREEDVFLDIDRYQISEDEIKEIANDQNRMFELIQNDVNKKAHSFSLVESPNFYFTSYYIGSFQNGEYLHTIIKKRDGENLTYKAVAIDGVKVDLVLVGRNQGDEMIYSLNPEQIEMMTSENISILSNAFKIDVKPEKPILIFGTPR
jgi:hypothetical protein